MEGFNWGTGGEANRADAACQAKCCGSCRCGVGGCGDFWMAAHDGVTYSSRMVRELLEIHTITVEGLHHLDKEKVIELAQVKQGVPLYQIVTASIEGKIESHPWIKEAEVSRVPFHELRIAVIERKPAAVVRAASQNFLSDEEGYVLTKLGQVDDDAFPLVTGLTSMAC